MIEGFRVQVSGFEIATHCQEKQAYHAARAEAYAKQAEDVGALQASDGGPSQYTNSPSRSLAESAERHTKQAAFFGFLAKHTPITETYSLGERDLEYLGITERRNW